MMPTSDARTNSMMWRISALSGTCCSIWFTASNVDMIAWENPEPICRFPFAVQNYYGTWRFSINLLEGLAAIVFLVVLLRMKKRKTGGAASLLLLMYASCQILFESMRKDEVIIWGFVKANQLISALLVLGILIFCWLKLPKQQRSKRELTFRLVMIFLAAGIVMLMEFALDQKVSFLMWMRADLSYIVLALCCAGMAACCIWMLAVVVPLWKKAFPRED